MLLYSFGFAFGMLCGYLLFHHPLIEKIDDHTPLYKKILAYRADQQTWVFTSFISKDLALFKHPEFAYTHYIDFKFRKPI